VKKLLFRVFDKERNEMSEPFPLGTPYYIFNEKDGSKYPTTMESMALMLVNPDRFIVMQYTGLHDSTKWEQLTPEEQKAWLDKSKTKEEWPGKMIFEGDIVKCPLQEESADYLWLEADKYNRDYVLRTMWLPECYLEGFPDGVEILGNVHEHKHLLEAL
jgi:hypothetical protein